jgi:cytoskeletal protein RodZ
MNQQYIKIAGLTLAIFLAVYIFFPVSAKQSGKPEQATPAPVASVTPNNSEPAANKSEQANAEQAKAKSSKKTSSAKSSTSTKSTAQKIEPEKTLRKAETRGRSGPPSKMYGGL